MGRTKRHSDEYRAAASARAAAEFTGSTPAWLGGVVATPRRAAVTSTVYNLAVSAARAEFDRLAARRKYARRAVSGDGVRDGAALEAASA